MSVTPSQLLEGPWGLRASVSITVVGQLPEVQMCGACYMWSQWLPRALPRGLEQCCVLGE